ILKGARPGDLPIEQPTLSSAVAAPDVANSPHPHVPMADCEGRAPTRIGGTSSPVSLLKEAASRRPLRAPVRYTRCPSGPKASLGSADEVCDRDRCDLDARVTHSPDIDAAGGCCCEPPRISQSLTDVLITRGAERYVRLLPSCRICPERT